IARMRGGQGARRRRARTRLALRRVSGRIGGRRTVVGCITRRGPRDAVDPQRVHCSDLRIRYSHVPPLEFHPGGGAIREAGGLTALTLRSVMAKVSNSQKPWLAMLGFTLWASSSCSQEA